MRAGKKEKEAQKGRIFCTSRSLQRSGLCSSDIETGRRVIRGGLLRVLAPRVSKGVIRVTWRDVVATQPATSRPAAWLEHWQDGATNGRSASGIWRSGKISRFCYTWATLSSGWPVILSERLPRPGRPLSAELEMNGDEPLKQQGSLVSIPDLEADAVDRHRAV